MTLSSACAYGSRHRHARSRCGVPQAPSPARSRGRRAHRHGRAACGPSATTPAAPTAERPRPRPPPPRIPAVPHSSHGPSSYSDATSYISSVILRIECTKRRSNGTTARDYPVHRPTPARPGGGAQRLPRRWGRSPRGGALQPWPRGRKWPRRRSAEARAGDGAGELP